MAKKQTLVTAEMLREAYIANLEAKRKTNAVAIADFTEKELAEFIRHYADSRFIGIYEELDHNYYDRVRERLLPMARCEQLTRKLTICILSI